MRRGYLYQKKKKGEFSKFYGSGEERRRSFGQGSL